MLSNRREAHRTAYAADHDLDATDAFQRHATDLLSLAWTSRLLNAFLLCLKELCALPFGPGAVDSVRRPHDRLVANSFDCNAVRDVLDLVHQWRKHVAIATVVLAAAASNPRHCRRSRRPRSDTCASRSPTSPSSWPTTGRAAQPLLRMHHQEPPVHHRRSRSGGNSGSGLGCPSQVPVVEHVPGVVRGAVAIGHQGLHRDRRPFLSRLP
ncbi:hypothetical protein HU200_007462 [Digitaria exilis]|uniref:Uncharacterized protein n=1 Tax=Digitaria exilis TaxID=1010633 RepID=A0A835FNB1_9POAL|nr:hypothetical protein HU200_007462 [Digitaria exilis]